MTEGRTAVKLSITCQSVGLVGLPAAGDTRGVPDNGGAICGPPLEARSPVGSHRCRRSGLPGTACY